MGERFCGGMSGCGTGRQLNPPPPTPYLLLGTHRPATHSLATQFAFSDSKEILGESPPPPTRGMQTGPSLGIGTLSLPEADPDPAENDSFPPILTQRLVLRREERGFPREFGQRNCLRGQKNWLFTQVKRSPSSSKGFGQGSNPASPALTK